MLYQQLKELQKVENYDKLNIQHGMTLDGCV
jgi:hypothetical protein